MPLRIRLTVTTDMVEAADNDASCVDEADLIDANVSDEELTAALADVIRTRAERARYKHQPRAEFSEFGGRRSTDPA